MATLSGSVSGKGLGRRHHDKGREIREDGKVRGVEKGGTREAGMALR